MSCWALQVTTTCYIQLPIYYTVSAMHFPFLSFPFLLFSFRSFSFSEKKLVSMWFVAILLFTIPPDEDEGVWASVSVLFVCFLPCTPRHIGFQKMEKMVYDLTSTFSDTRWRRWRWTLMNLFCSLLPQCFSNSVVPWSKIACSLLTLRETAESWPDNKNRLWYLTYHGLNFH